MVRFPLSDRGRREDNERVWVCQIKVNRQNQDKNFLKQNMMQKTPRVQLETFFVCEKPDLTVVSGCFCDEAYQKIWRGAKQPEVEAGWLCSRKGVSI